MTLEVKFRLAFGLRKDEDAAVHVGYCPLLNLYSQGSTEAEAEDAIVDAAQLFIVTCYQRNSLHKILRGHGMVNAAPGAVQNAITNSEREFIAAKEFQDYDRQFEREVPIELLAAVGLDLSACRQ